jgi:multiple sugar transport system substrate-binding protein
VKRVLPAFLLLAATLSSAGCGGGDGEVTTLRFWAMGREGEVVQELVRAFERENPDIRVHVQQIPWSAAHEKLLTAYVGGSTPDISQLGNTWVAEFAALRAIEPLDTWVEASGTINPSAFFSGIWDTNVIDGVVYGIPWYVDTRVIFYRRDILERAGYTSMPDNWDDWKRAMRAICRLQGENHYAILLPINEFTQPVIFGLQNGSDLLRDDDTRGAFSSPEFREAYRFYVGLFEEGLAPPVSNTEVANLYQEFARGYFSMYITGPWNLGEFRRRIPEELQSAWATAPLPGPEGAASGVSLAGGASLVMFRGSKHKSETWRLIEYLARPENQVEFYRLTGDLPGRVESWRDTALTGDPHIRAFREQLERVKATPKIPEWEQIANLLQQETERATRGTAAPDTVLVQFDKSVDRILEKRRWLMEKRRSETATTRVETP